MRKGQLMFFTNYLKREITINIRFACTGACSNHFLVEGIDGVKSPPIGGLHELIVDVQLIRTQSEDLLTVPCRV